MVAGDFNGAACRRQSGNGHRHISTIEEAFANTCFPIPPGATSLWGPGGVPGVWADLYGFLLPPGSETEWHLRMHGAFKIPHDSLGIKRTDQSCHHKVWVHLLHVNARLVDRSFREDKYRRPRGRETCRAITVRKRGNPDDPVTIHMQKTRHPYDKVRVP